MTNTASKFVHRLQAWPASACRAWWLTGVDGDGLSDAAECAAAQAVVVEVEALQAQRVLQGRSQCQAPCITDLHSSSNNMHVHSVLGR
jgi:hypothetical protein